MNVLVNADRENILMLDYSSLMNATVGCHDGSNNGRKSMTENVIFLVRWIQVEDVEVHTECQFIPFN